MKAKRPEKGKAAAPTAEPEGDDITRVKRLLVPLLKDIGARWVLLIDRNGRPIAEHGEPGAFDMEALAPLIAGSFASMRFVAHLFGSEFVIMLHHGKRDNVQLSLVGDRAILAIVFGNQAPLGTARLCAQHVAKKLEAVIVRMGASRHGQLGPEFAEAVKTRLDELLG